MVEKNQNILGVVGDAARSSGSQRCVMALNESG